MIRLFLILSFIILVSPSWAQTYQNKSNGVEEDIASTNKGAIVLKNNRVYQFDKAVLLESFEIGDERFANYFDFENSLVYHKNTQSRRILEITQFNDLTSERIQELKKYACHIVEKSTTLGKQGAFFAERHCGGKQ